MEMSHMIISTIVKIDSGDASLTVMIFKYQLLGSFEQLQQETGAAGLLCCSKHSRDPVPLSDATLLLSMFVLMLPIAPDTPMLGNTPY